MTKGGRPRKGERERRIDHLNIRLTVAERAHLDAEARRLGMPVSRHVRRLIGRRRSADRHNVPAVSDGAITALNRVGNNLNQLARHVHAKGNLEPVASHLNQVLVRLDAVVDALLDRDQRQD